MGWLLRAEAENIQQFWVDNPIMQISRKYFIFSVFAILISCQTTLSDSHNIQQLWFKNLINQASPMIFIFSVFSPHSFSVMLSCCTVSVNCVVWVLCVVSLRVSYLFDFAVFCHRHWKKLTRQSWRGKAKKSLAKCRKRSEGQQRRSQSRAKTSARRRSIDQCRRCVLVTMPVWNRIDTYSYFPNFFSHFLIFSYLSRPFYGAGGFVE